jgi:glucose 1-dehydrogenase
MLGVDLHGTFFVTLHVVREMVKSKFGRIINITSVHQTVPKPGFAPYCVAKAGVGMLTQVLSSELAPYGIHINNIAPGAVESPMNSDLLKNPDLLQKTLDEIPLRRMAKPEEVAAMAVYLASYEADYVTGATFVIDGGLSELGAKY